MHVEPALQGVQSEHRGINQAHLSPTKMSHTARTLKTARISHLREAEESSPSYGYSEVALGNKHPSTVARKRSL